MTPARATPDELDARAAMLSINAANYRSVGMDRAAAGATDRARVLRQLAAEARLWGAVANDNEMTRRVA